MKAHGKFCETCKEFIKSNKVASHEHFFGGKLPQKKQRILTFWRVCIEEWKAHENVTYYIVANSVIQASNRVREIRRGEKLSVDYHTNKVVLMGKIYL